MKCLMSIFLALCTGCPKNITPRCLCLLWRSCSFSCFLGFYPVAQVKLKSIRQRVVADLWQKKGEISDYFKSSTSVVLQQCENQVMFERNRHANFFGTLLEASSLCCLSCAINQQPLVRFAQTRSQTLIGSLALAAV